MSQHLFMTFSAILKKHHSPSDSLLICKYLNIMVESSLSLMVHWKKTELLKLQGE